MSSSKRPHSPSLSPRPTKRRAPTDSPEEGELDDASVPPTSQESTETLKPVIESKVKFPFKKNTDPPPPAAGRDERDAFSSSSRSRHPASWDRDDADRRSWDDRGGYEQRGYDRYRPPDRYLGGRYPDYPGPRPPMRDSYVPDYGDHDRFYSRRDHFPPRHQYGGDHYRPVYADDLDRDRIRDFDADREREREYGRDHDVYNRSQTRTRSPDSIRSRSRSPRPHHRLPPRRTPPPPPPPHAAHPPEFRHDPYRPEERGRYERPADYPPPSLNYPEISGGYKESYDRHSPRPQDGRVSPAPPSDPIVTAPPLATSLPSRPGAPLASRTPKSVPIPSRSNSKPPTAVPENVPELPKKHVKKTKYDRTREEEIEAYGRPFVGSGSLKDYEVGVKLGEGTFGEVHKAKHRDTGVAVALKRILMHNEKEGMPITALREIKILKSLSHPNVVKVLDVVVQRGSPDTPGSVYMVFPYMDHDLAGLLQNPNVKLQMSTIKLYMKQILEGVHYLHRNKILHRDIKAANLLVSNNGSLQLADFGLARPFDPKVAEAWASRREKGEKYTNCVVTRWYRPPELLMGERYYGAEVDIWGVGCIMGEMFRHRPILEGTSDLDQLDKIWNLCGTPTEQNWPGWTLLDGCDGIKTFHPPRSNRIQQDFEEYGPDTVDLLIKLLTLHPRSRISAADALDHAYFWTDPMPADPKTLAQYESSHEYDRRGRRQHVNNQNQRPPVLPPVMSKPHALPQPQGFRGSGRRGPPRQDHRPGQGHPGLPQPMGFSNRPPPQNRGPPGNRPPYDSWRPGPHMNQGDSGGLNYG